MVNELRQNSLLCDVTIKLEYNGQRKKFTAHKLVLAACSPYFRAMFTGKPCDKMFVRIKKQLIFSAVLY